MKHAGNGATSSLVMVLSLLPWISSCFDNSFYYPNDTVYETPADYDLPWEEVSFESRDKTRLHGWFIHAAGTPVGTIIYFYGDFANRTYYLRHIYWLPRSGFNVFTFDYRGYGDSGGTPDRSGIYEDSVAAIQYVLERSDVDRRNLFLYAQSLGAAFAVAAVARNDFPGIRAVVLEGAFTSFRAEARYMMLYESRKAIGEAPCLTWPIQPVTFMGVSNAFSPIDSMDQVSPVPLLIVHCTSDRAVPYSHAEELFERAKTPKYLWPVEGCEHVTLFKNWEFSDKYRQMLVDFFKAHRSESSAISK